MSREEEAAKALRELADKLENGAQGARVSDVSSTFETETRQDDDGIERTRPTGWRVLKIRWYQEPRS